MPTAVHASASAGAVAGQSAGSQQDQMLESFRQSQTRVPYSQSPRAGVQVEPAAGSVAGHTCPIVIPPAPVAPDVPPLGTPPAAVAPPDTVAPPEALVPPEPGDPPDPPPPLPVDPDPDPDDPPVLPLPLSSEPPHAPATQMARTPIPATRKGAPNAAKSFIAILLSPGQAARSTR
jgi:hypothetical protein